MSAFCSDAPFADGCDGQEIGDTPGGDGHIDINNTEFLQAIFGSDYGRAHVTAFRDSPDKIDGDRRGSCWEGGAYSKWAKRLTVDKNTYFTISLFNSDPDGKARRRKALFDRSVCVVVDDVGTKVQDTSRLLPPSWDLETSAGNSQWGYKLRDPDATQARVSGLLGAMVAKDLCSDGSDPGMKGVTRYVRLPVGSNRKSGWLEKLGPEGWRCRLLRWSPERVFTVDEIMAQFGITEEELIAHSDQSHSGAPSSATCKEDPVLKVISAAGMYKSPAGPGWHNVTCPNQVEHSNQDDSGSAVYVGADGTYGYQCHHGHCEQFKFADFVDLFDQAAGNTVLGDAVDAERLKRDPEEFDAVQDDEGEEIDPDTGEIKKRVHPLAKFIDYEAEARAPDWVLPGLVGTGIVTWAGSAGVGKTSVLLPTAMAAASLHEPGYELAPKHWRHVVYITEDTAQARRIVAGMLGCADLALNKQTVIERLHIVEAMRMDVKEVAKVGKVYREMFTRVVQGVELAPLVVVDTKAAVLATDDENSNSEASRIVNVLKQGFENLPTWIVGHVAKQNVNRADLASLSMRGGSAFEADANQCLYIVKEGQEGAEQRYMVRGKTRFEAKWSELAIQSYTSSSTAKDQWGDDEDVTLRWAIAAPGLRTRAQAKAVAQEDSRSESDAFTRGEILEAVREACEAGTRLNRAAVKAKVKRKAAAVVQGLEVLLADGRLVEVHVPPNMRVHPKKDSFLIDLNSDEQEELNRSGTVPPTKLEIPPSWKKAGIDGAARPVSRGTKEPISSVPEVEPVSATARGKT